jgi:hypothetical protein
MVDRRTLRIINGAIAMKGFLKKDLARTCGISPSQLSLYLHGDVQIPFKGYESLVRELRLANTLVSIRTREPGEG